MINTEEYYKGRESILREHMDGLAKSNVELQAEAYKLKREAEEAAETIKCLKNEVHSVSEQVGRMGLKEKEDRKLINELTDTQQQQLAHLRSLLLWVMSIDNRSAEERLRCIRRDYRALSEQLGVTKPIKPEPKAPDAPDCAYCEGSINNHYPDCPKNKKEKDPMRDNYKGPIMFMNGKHYPAIVDEDNITVTMPKSERTFIKDWAAEMTMAPLGSTGYKRDYTVQLDNHKPVIVGGIWPKAYSDNPKNPIITITLGYDTPRDLIKRL